MTTPLSPTQTAAVQAVTTQPHVHTCPACGHPLQPVALDPDTAPWLCPPTGCRSGWWVSELTTQARNAYRHGNRDFGFGPHRGAIQAQVELERVAARQRGTSALPEQLPLLPSAELTRLANGPDTEFVALVTAELARRVNP